MPFFMKMSVDRKLFLLTHQLLLHLLNVLKEFFYVSILRILLSEVIQ